MPDISKHEAVIQAIESGTYATLGLRIGSQTVTPGLKVSKQETRTTPTLFAPSTPLAPGTYTLIAIDIDAPYFSWNVLSPIVHWIQTGFVVPSQKTEGEPESEPGAEQSQETATNQDNDALVELKSTDSVIVPWLPAGPPPGTAPHRYVFALYKQTPGASVPGAGGLKGLPKSRLGRMRFDVEGMVGQLGLGEVVAGNYFVCN
ncbi:phosphatidylethanolamine-binding protein [Aspergillus pseudoustus]|uniref:Phosphatidylethanolamine-binding protein n=1 Tax=Aspergillus pseudoustus TaxID=1810923 RepID=A0ABR4KYK5_9EURO